MALPFFNGSSKKKLNQVIAIDLGTRTTKAVLMERRGDGFALTRYALVDAPIYDKKISTELLAEHLRSISQALGGTIKTVALSLGPDDSVVRQVELPMMTVDEMRQILKINAKVILQQDLPGHVFDCHILPLDVNGKVDKSGNLPKVKVLVTAAKQQLVRDYQTAARDAGLHAECVVPGLIGPLNAFEMALPQVFANDAVAVVDIGFKHSTICLLDRGRLVLTRGVNIGGDKLTTGLAEGMSISYAEAEGIKVGLAPEAKTILEAQVMPLGRELRASIDFFEHQQDRPVSQVFVCGAAARSEMFLEMLRAEMIVECKAWNPTTFLQMALPGQQAMDVEHLGPQLSVAIGAAVAAF